MKSTILSSLLFLFTVFTVCSQQQIILHFQYGSVPAKGFKQSESRYFGGISGGHVTIEIDGMVIGFAPGGNCHLWGKRKKPNGYFHYGKGLGDTTGMKYTSFIIPVSDSQYQQLKTIAAAYSRKAPYDYATFGMRCAAAASDMLSQAGLLKTRTKPGHVLRYFYPKKLRKHFFRLTAKRHYSVIRHPGRSSRRWEKDRFDD